jgi:hypothetical protein
MAIEIDHTAADIELLTIRISEALYTHARVIRQEEGDPDHGISTLAVTRDEEDGWLEVALTDTREQGVVRSEVYHVQITNAKGD